MCTTRFIESYHLIEALLGLLNTLSPLLMPHLHIHLVMSLNCLVLEFFSFAISFHYNKAKFDSLNLLLKLNNSCRPFIEAPLTEPSFNSSNYIVLRTRGSKYNWSTTTSLLGVHVTLAWLAMKSWRALMSE